MEYLNAYVLCNIIAAVVSIIIGSCFLFISIPDNPTLHNYKNTRKMLTLAYFILGIGDAAAAISFDRGLILDKSILFVIVLAIASYQAFLFTYALITLINPNYLITSKFVIQAIVITCFLSGSVVSIAIGNSQTISIVNYIVYFFYIGQLCYYVSLFFREKKKFTIELGNFYAGNELKKLNWVNFAFMSSFGIGVIVAFHLLSLKEIVHTFFILFYTVFYLYFGIKFLNYPHQFAELKDSFIKFPEVSNSITYPELKNNIDKWISSKGFLNSNLTIIKLASELNTNRTYLSNCINSTMQMNFNTWINTLRVNEALAIMEQHPDWSLLKISEEAGFTDSTCFGKQFKKITGLTPGTVKANYLKMSEKND